MRFIFILLITFSLFADIENCEEEGKLVVQALVIMN